MSADHSFKRPEDSSLLVKPGPGAEDLMQLPYEPVERLLKAAHNLVGLNSGRTHDTQPWPFGGVQNIYRILGSPRSWQLGGEQVLRQLSEEDRNWLANAARALLDGTDRDGYRLQPGQKYFVCNEPPMMWDESWPALDLADSELVENYYWMVTMPVEFVERIAALDGPRN